MHCSPLIYVFPLISPLVFILSMVSDWFIAQIPCPASAAAFLRPCRWAPWVPWVPCIRMITFMTRSDESPGLRCPTVSHGVPRCPTVSHVWFMDVYGLWGVPRWSGKPHWRCPHLVSSLMIHDVQWHIFRKLDEIGRSENMGSSQGSTSSHHSRGPSLVGSSMAPGWWILRKNLPKQLLYVHASR